jgi:hypothetical protein
MPALDDRYFVPTENFLAAFADLGPIDYEEFRADIDRYVDPSPREWPED